MLFVLKVALYEKLYHAKKGASVNNALDLARFVMLCHAVVRSSTLYYALRCFHMLSYAFIHFHAYKRLYMALMLSFDALQAADVLLAPPQQDVDR